MDIKQQTAVEWLFGQIPSACKSSKGAFDALQQAKAMEMEQKANTWNNAINAVEKDKWESFEQYYNETYGGGNNE
jgi:hypothetical protein